MLVPLCSTPVFLPCCCVRWSNLLYNLPGHSMARLCAQSLDPAGILLPFRRAYQWERRTYLPLPHLLRVGRTPRCRRVHCRKQIYQWWVVLQNESANPEVTVGSNRLHNIRAYPYSDLTLTYGETSLHQGQERRFEAEGMGRYRCLDYRS